MHGFDSISCVSGAIGYTSRINANGDAEGNYTLIGIRKLNSSSYSKAPVPLGVFQLSHNLSDLPVRYVRVVSSRSTACLEQL